MTKAFVLITTEIGKGDQVYETLKQIEAQLLMRNYEGFIR